MTLRIPIGTQCGTVQSGRGRYVNHVVIQANPVIMQVEIGIDCFKETPRFKCHYMVATALGR